MKGVLARVTFRGRGRGAYLRVEHRTPESNTFRTEAKSFEHAVVGAALAHVPQGPKSTHSVPRVTPPSIKTSNLGSSSSSGRDRRRRTRVASGGGEKSS